MHRNFANEGGLTCFLHDLGGAVNPDSLKGQGLSGPRSP